LVNKNNLTWPKCKA